MKFYILSLCVFLTSCYQQSTFEKDLINNKWIFYDFHKLENKNIKIISYLEFKKNGDCFYIYRDTGEQFGSKGIWNYSEKDSLLEAYGSTLKILNIKGDTILVHDLNKKYNSIFFKYHLQK